MTSTPSSESEGHRTGRRVAPAAIGAVVCAVLAISVVLNPRLGWFALTGFIAGWLIAQAWHRRWKRLELVGITLAVVFTIGLVVGFFVLLFNTCINCGRAPTDRVAIRMTSRLEWDAEREVFQIADQAVVSAAGSTALAEQLIMIDRPIPLDQVSSTLAQIPQEQRDYLVQRAIESAGWAFVGTEDGRPVFTHPRTVSADVPVWPLSVTRTIDRPIIEPSQNLLFEFVPDGDSAAIVIAPARFIRQTSPKAASTEPVLDGRGSEATRVPIGTNNTLGGAIRLELVSPLARNPVIGPLLQLSWWSTAQWFVLLVAAVFRNQVQEALIRLVQLLTRRVELRKNGDPGSIEGSRGAKDPVSSNLRRE